MSQEIQRLGLENASVLIMNRTFAGQSQIIKITRSNKQPLTQESMRAIVKEVTGYDSANVKVSSRVHVCPSV